MSYLSDGGEKGERFENIENGVLSFKNKISTAPEPDPGLKRLTCFFIG
jgi:hypothetical protein